MVGEKSGADGEELGIRLKGIEKGRVELNEGMVGRREGEMRWDDAVENLEDCSGNWSVELRNWR